jgi:hypothetical protein
VQDQRLAGWNGEIHKIHQGLNAMDSRIPGARAVDMYVGPGDNACTGSVVFLEETPLCASAVVLLASGARNTVG